MGEEQGLLRGSKVIVRTAAGLAGVSGMPVLALVGIHGGEPPRDRVQC